MRTERKAVSCREASAGFILAGATMPDMRWRILFSVLIAALLVAGPTASALCEMSCLPQAQQGLCCSHHVVAQAMTHCEHSRSLWLTDAHACDHPQQAAVIANTVACAGISVIHETESSLHVPPVPVSMPEMTSLRPVTPVPLRI